MTSTTNVAGEPAGEGTEDQQKTMYIRIKVCYRAVRGR